MAFVGRQWGGREIRAAEIKKLRLQIAYPPGASKAHIDVLEEFKSELIPSEELSINKERERQKSAAQRRASTSNNSYDDRSKMRRINSSERYDPAFLEADETTFEIIIEEKSGIWQNTPGYNCEKNAFPTETRKSANISGTFPTIDDFRNGIATSLKTINIVEKYGDKPREQIQKVLQDHWVTLADFNGYTWPAGDNYQGEPSLLIDGDNGRKLIQVKGEDIEKLRLQVAIPPISKIISDKRYKLERLENEQQKNPNPSNLDLKEGLKFEIQKIQDKKKAVDDFAESVQKQYFGQN